MITLHMSYLGYYHLRNIIFFRFVRKATLQYKYNDIKRYGNRSLLTSPLVRYEYARFQTVIGDTS